MGARLLLTLFLMTLPANAEPPRAKKIDQIDDYHGVRVADPYRWMEDLDSADTKAWIQAENVYTSGWLGQVAQRPALLERMKQLWNFERMPGRATSIDMAAGISERNGKVFYQLQQGLQNQPVLWVKDSAKSEGRVLLDVNPLAADGTAAVSVWAASPDAKWLVYGVAKAGSDWQEWRVRDVQTGKDSTDHLEWIKFSSPSWAADSKGFYYSRYPKPESTTAMTGANEYNKLYYHALGTPQSEDRLIYERSDQKLWRFSPTATEDGRYLVIRVLEGTRREHQLYYLDLKNRAAGIQPLITEFYAANIFLGNAGSKAYLLTSFEAPKNRVVEMDTADPDRRKWKTVVAETGDTLTAAVLAGDSLMLHYLHNATSRVVVYSMAAGKSRELPLPKNSTLTLATDTARYVSAVGFTAPETIYGCENGCKPMRKADLPFDPAQFETHQVFYPSKDGTKVSMFLAHKKGLARNGKNPTLLYGYGGFDISVTPMFRPLFIGWMEKGGILAIANLRGGGEYGEAWHAAGMKQNKQNVFDDFIAAGEWLIGEKYTSREKLAIWGASNGGLLVGACLNQRPDLFGAAIPAVGVMDMLRFHKFTAGPAWMSEYGSPDNPEDFRTIYRYSPIHNIKPGAKYPATLVLTADHDDRVVPSHSFKYGATLQAAQGGPAPILVRIETSAGHGGGKPTGKRIEEDADILAFLHRALAMLPSHL